MTDDDGGVRGGNQAVKNDSGTEAITGLPSNGEATGLPAISYRPEIDGLRAVAVLMVVLYHAGIGVPGGFIGVDVFFVISGFLITSLIWRDLQQDVFSFAHFWERRARRILPALFAVGLATLAAGWFILWPDAYADLAHSAQAQAVFLANVFFKRSGGYFDGPLDQAPLLHTWSLSVEEQFYLFIPLLLLALRRHHRARSRSVILVVLASALVCSLAFNTAGAFRHRSSAFYLMPGRGWELLLGSLTALTAGMWPATRRSLRELGSLIGLAMIVAPAFIYGKDTPFPGLAALPPCLGTCLVIWANQPSRTFSGAALASRPVVFVGLISYSLYLWHWPLLAFSRAAFSEPLSLNYRLVMVGLSFVLAVLSWRWVETPFRQRRLCWSRKSIYAFAAAGLTGLFAMTAIIRFSDGFPSRLGAGRLAYEAGRNDRGLLTNVKMQDIRADNLLVLGAAPADAPVSILLWGDSHAMAIAPAVDGLCRELGISGRAVVRMGTPPVLGYVKPGGLAPSAEPLTYTSEVLTYVQRHHVRDVILAAYWHSCPPTGGPKSESNLETGLLRTVESLVRAGAHPWILLQIPVQPFDVPRTLAKAAIAREDIAARCTKPDPGNGFSAWNDRSLVDKLTAAGGRLLDPRPRFLNPAGDHYLVSVDGTPLYYDSNHLTKTGARLMILPLLRETIGATLTKTAKP
ncbi:MAG: acyltransferase family protein [Chthoniobacteraceae bacterium]